jgi:hypothetical protein
MRKDYFQWLFLLFSLAALVASIITLNPYLILISGLLSASSAFLVKGWDIVESMIFRKTNVVQLFDGYEIGGSRETAVRLFEGHYIATAASSLSIGKIVTVDQKAIENIIAHLDFPFRFVLQAERVDVGKLVDSLKTKRGMREIELSRTSGDKDSRKATAIRREIEQIESDIREIGSSGIPIRAAHYLLTSGSDENRSAAETKALSQISSLSAEFDAALCSRSRILSGGELVSLLKADSEWVIG